MNLVQPIVGQWYRIADELFEIVAIDEADETIEVQYFDGTVTELDFDAWNEQIREQRLDAVDAPEDWSGSVDADAADLGLESEEGGFSAWTNAQEQSLRRG
jgi:hypothetical protein